MRLNAELLGEVVEEQGVLSHQLLITTMSIASMASDFSHFDVRWGFIFVCWPLLNLYSVTGGSGSSPHVQFCVRCSESETWAFHDL